MKVACPSCDKPMYLSEDEVPEDGAQSICSSCAAPMAFVHVPAADGEEVFGPPAQILDTSTPFFDHFRSRVYTLRTRPFKIFGGGVEIYDPAGSLCGYVHQKALRVKEAITLYADENRTHELLEIRAKTLQDVSGLYEVTDPASGQRIGALRRKGVKSVMRDTWTLLDAGGEEAGAIQEDSRARAAVRRFLPFGFLLPQTFEGRWEDRTVFRFEQQFNPFVLYLELNFYPDVEERLDRRLGIAAGILLSLVEGHQSR